MARMSNKRRLEWSFFLNDRSRITYNELCRKCQHKCKQSSGRLWLTARSIFPSVPRKRTGLPENGKIP